MLGGALAGFGLPGGKAAGWGVMNRNDTAAGTGLLGGGLPGGKKLGGGLPGGKKRKERQPARVGGAGEGGGVCQLANLSTFRLFDFSICWEVGELERCGVPGLGGRGEQEGSGFLVYPAG